MGASVIVLRRPKVVSIDVVVSNLPAAQSSFGLIQGGSLLLKDGKLPPYLIAGSVEYKIIELPGTDTHGGLSCYPNRMKRQLIFEGYNHKNSGHRGMANEILQEAQLRYKPIKEWTIEDVQQYEMLSLGGMIGW